MEVELPENNDNIGDELAKFEALVEARQKHVASLYNTPNQPSKTKFSFLISIPHSTPVHSLAFPPCSSHIYTGGQDGFIRKHSLFEMLNYPSRADEHVRSLTMKLSGTGMDLTGECTPVLVGYWENEILGSLSSSNNVGNGAKVTVQGGDGFSPVYSLAVNKQELWALGGTDKGAINLFSARIDEGHIRHIFLPNQDSAKGHSQPVSCLTLTPGEDAFLSGGWDTRIHNWDLNTGRLRQTHLGHDYQISTLAFRPISVPFAHSNTKDDNMESLSPTMSAKSSDSKMDQDAEGELDADGELDTDDIATNGVQKDPFQPKSKSSEKVPIYDDKTELSNDVFLSSGLDGQIMIWDRRAHNSVWKLAQSKENRWCASASWVPTSNSTQIIVGREAQIGVYDLRHTTASAPTIHTIKLPRSSGSVYSVTGYGPSGIISATWDVIRIWDVDKKIRGEEYFSRVIPGHQGGYASHIAVDPSNRFLFCTFGNRGWSQMHDWEKGGYEGETTSDTFMIWEIASIV